MTIAAERFGGFKENFNVAVADFKSLRDSEILNKPLDQIKEVTESAKDLISQLKEQEQGLLGEAKDMVSEATRFTENIFDSFTDLAKLPEAFIKETIDDLFPGDLSSLAGAFKNLTKVCRDKALGSSLGLGSIKGPGCGGLDFGANSCPPGPASNILSKIGLGAIGDVLKAGANLLGRIMALANLGFNANLCNVFSGLIKDVTSLPLIGTAAALLTNQQGLKGNLTALADISKTTGALSIGVNSFIPDTIRNVAKGFVPVTVASINGLQEVGERLTGTLELLEPSYLKSPEGGISTANFSDASQAFTEAFTSHNQYLQREVMFFDENTTISDEEWAATAMA